MFSLRHAVPYDRESVLSAFFVGLWMRELNPASLLRKWQRKPQRFTFYADSIAAAIILPLQEPAVLGIKRDKVVPVERSHYSAGTCVR